MRPRRLRAAGLARARRPAAAPHRRARRSRSGAGRRDASLRRDPRLGRRRATSTATARPRWSPRTCEGKVYAWNADGTLRFKREAEPRLLRQAAPAVRERAPGPALPHPARLPRLAGASRTSTATAAARDRRRRHGPPRLRLARATATPVPASRCSSSTARRSPSIDPQTARADVQRRTPAPSSTRARSSTRPRSATSTATGSPRSSSGRTRSTRRTTTAASTPATSTRRRSAVAGARPGSSKLGNTPAATRSSPTGEPGGPTRQRPSPYLAGWPVEGRHHLHRAAAGRGRGHHRLAR